MSRLSRADWTKLGRELLAEQGPAALTVARVCERAGKTRGSLYHHFADHDALLRAVLESWREASTDALIAAHPPGSGAAAALDTSARGLDFALEQNVRKLVAGRAELRETVREVDEARIAHLTRLHVHDGLSRKHARMRAQIEYAAYLGFQQLEIPDRRLGELYRWMDPKLR